MKYILRYSPSTTTLRLPECHVFESGCVPSVNRVVWPEQGLKDLKNTKNSPRKAEALGHVRRHRGYKGKDIQPTVKAPKMAESVRTVFTSKSSVTAHRKEAVLSAQTLQGNCSIFVEGLTLGRDHRDFCGRARPTRWRSIRRMTPAIPCATLFEAPSRDEP